MSESIEQQFAQELTRLHVDALVMSSPKSGTVTAMVTGAVELHQLSVVVLCDPSGIVKCFSDDITYMNADEALASMRRLPDEAGWKAVWERLQPRRLIPR